MILLQRSGISLLSASGVLYLSPSSHILAGTLPTITPSYTPGDAEVGLTGVIVASTFYYSPNNLPLNYDTDTPPPPPPPPVPPVIVTSRQDGIIYLFTVANAQMFDLLPTVGRYWQWPYNPTLCESSDRACQKNTLFKLKTFQLENRLKE